MTEGEQRMSKALEKAHWKIKELEAEVQEQCRINGMGAERELALMAKVERLERENETNERNLCQLTDELAATRRENAELRNATLEEAAVKCEQLDFSYSACEQFVSGAAASECAEEIRSLKS